MRPKVLHIVISLNHGGLERQVVLLAGTRDRQNAGSTFIACLDERGILADHLPPDVVKCVEARRNRFPWDVAAVRNIRRIIKKEGIDIVHSHNLAAQQYGALAAWGIASHVNTQHGPNPHNDGWRDRFKTRLLKSRTDWFSGVSEDTRMVMIKRGIPQDRVSVIPNCVDVATFAPRSADSGVKHEFGMPQDALVVGTIARFTPEKNLLMLIEAFSKIVEKYPSVFLLIVGDGPDRSVIEKSVYDKGLDRRCMIVGFQTDVIPFLGVMDIFCLSSASEGISVALLEAGAMGIPAVVTDVGGNAEVVRSGINGLTVKSNDRDGFANALDRFCRDKSLRKEMGTQAREMVMERYSLDRVLVAYEGIYDRVRKEGF
ncbi:MAG: glycosyltransferase [Lentisphaerae bacterium]|nr:glycosyltransferase [Lentisphaerota bacterium]